jgi:tripeptide aminopeptidase
MPKGCQVDEISPQRGCNPQPLAYCSARRLSCQHAELGQIAVCYTARATGIFLEDFTASSKVAGRPTDDAEGVVVPLSPDLLETIRATSADRVEATADLTLNICAVPAPTGDEGDRAKFVADLLRQRGYDAEIDDVHNVYATRGNADGPSLMLLAHIDTVFPRETPLDVRREGNRLHGPGIGDNCLAVAAMISTLDVLDELGLETAANIRVVANVGEEGLGNLRGAWRALERFGSETGAVIAIEGHKVGRATHVGVGSNRWKVTVNGPGGHSWGAFGLPSAIHGLGRIIAAISNLTVPEDPKTTFNVGMIEGGTSINTIAPTASAMIDMRSWDPDSLAHLSAQVREIIETAAGEGLTTELDVLGERPAGSTSKDHPIVHLLEDVHQWLGIETIHDASSTDANVPISMGIPAICVGISRGDRVHTIYEYVDVEPIANGLAQLVRYTLDLTELISTTAS